ncbi:hypothetical protein DFH08DRAFT_890635 [Mycena albidolilacea]|uniref:Concanavalin A-like lectin/glucanase n=1 Tax=Mycena albidolilacea TaxID=1033008 RepID=A0AAD6ZF01_9AGAR|nr:hypothetical protein DFH08DRAFT_890635 [Mycena albidolilacea]
MRFSSLTVLLAPLAFTFTLAKPTGNDKIPTPGGHRPSSSVYEITAGGSLSILGAAVHVLAADGNIVHVSTASVGGQVPTKLTGDSSRALQTNGWIAYAWWLNPGLAPISSFATTWVVPPAPETYHGQTIFLFNGIQPNASSAILQPVLQYGPSNAGGNASWAVAIWFVYSTGNAFFTTPVPVDPGATLEATITLIASNGTTFDYNAQFSNVPGTSMNVTGSRELTFAVETLEAYGVSSISDYPVGSTVFEGIQLGLVDDATPSVVWSHEDDAADGVLLAVDRDGANDARMTITY